MAAASKNFFVKLYCGYVPLVVTFWLFYFAFGWFLIFIFPPLVRVILFTYLSLAAWNSASHYQGFVFWRDLTKIVVAIVGAVQIVAIYRLLT